MADPLVPDVIVNVCHSCAKSDVELPQQWQQHGFLAVVREVPCDGRSKSASLGETQ